MARKVSAWRKRFHPDEVIQRVRPEHTDEYLGNPHKGTATFQRFNGDPLYPGIQWNDREGPTTFPPPVNADLSNDRYPPTTLSYCRWLWSVLEPAKGKFRWDLIDAALATAAERGQTLQFRSQPFIGEFTPRWYWDTGAHHDKVAFAERGYRVPCHNDPRYLKHWGDHMRALGRRYDGHPALESVDVAYGGSCGETGGNTKNPTAERLVDVYFRAFRKTQLVMMLGTHGCRYAARRYPAHRVGWRADCYGDVRTDGRGSVPNGLNWNHMIGSYPKEVHECGVKDNWKAAPVTFETCWTVGYWGRRKWDIDWIIDQGYKYHVSVFMPKSVYVPARWMGKIMAFNKRIGYRFHLQEMILPLEARRGGRVRMEAIIDNKGIAPIYRDYRFALRFTQRGRHHVVRLAESIRKWLPDFSYFKETFALPKSLKPGPAAVACGIVDDSDRPVVRLAIKDIDKAGWHPLTHMDIL